MLAPPLSPGKFVDPFVTRDGSARASLPFTALKTLWINTGTLCNIECKACYIDSSPTNDRLSYITRAEAKPFLDEAARMGAGEIGFTGGEPFMNRDMLAILAETLNRGFETLVLTNAMRPMLRHQKQLKSLHAVHGRLLRFRVSLDDHRPDIHDAERGKGSFAKAMEGLRFLSREGFQIEIAGRRLGDDPEAVARVGYRDLFRHEGIAINCDDPVQLVIFPEMVGDANPPEITEACWGILHKSPDDVMCATARMVVRRKGADAPAVVACTLIAYDERFELGRTLKQADVSVPLNHRYCATFCVLGGAACGVKKS